VGIDIEAFSNRSKGHIKGQEHFSKDCTSALGGGLALADSPTAEAVGARAALDPKCVGKEGGDNLVNVMI
jgi:hypothetical protein